MELSKILDKEKELTEKIEKLEVKLMDLSSQVSYLYEPIHPGLEKMYADDMLFMENLLLKYRHQVEILNEIYCENKMKEEEGNE